MTLAITIFSYLAVSILLHVVLCKFRYPLKTEKVLTRLDILENATSDTIWDWDLLSDSVWWNHGVKSHFGYRSEQVKSTGAWWLSKLHPEDREQISSSIHIALEKGAEVWSGEYRFLKADGSYANIYDRGQIFRNNKGVAIRMIGGMLDITQRVASAAALEASIERLDLALTSSGVGTWDWNIEQNTIIWDESLHRLFGLQPGAFTGGYQSFLNCLHAEDSKRVAEEVSAAVDGAKKYDTEYRAVWPDGSVHHLASRGRVYRDSAGKPTQMTGVCWDITRQKVTDQELVVLNKTLEQRVLQRTDELRLKNVELEENEEMFRATFEQAAVGICHLSAETGTWVRVNKKYCNLVGYSREELLTMSIADISDPLDLPKNLAAVKKMISGEIESYTTEKQYIKKDRSYIWVYLNSRLIKSKAGVPKYFVTVVQDITQLKQIQHDLKESLGQFKLLAEAMPQQIWSANPDGSLDYFNPQCLQYFGRTHAEMAVQGWQAVIHPEDLGKCIEKWTYSLKTGQNYEIEFRLRRGSDGEFRWHLGRALPLTDQEGKITKWFGTNTDVDAQKRAEKVIGEQKIAMMHSSKMSALGEMAGGIAHEINNPLAIIHGKAGQLKELAQEGQVTAEFVIKTAEKIEQTALRISKIVKSLRTVARDGDHDPFVATPLQQVIEETLELCRERFRNHGVVFKAGAFSDGLSVECRPGQLSQVLLNVLNNAHDAIAEQTEKWISLEVYDTGTTICLRITDSGNGIPEDTAQKIMQPFFTTKPPGKGTGLGLSVSKGILEAHSGSIRVDGSGPNTCFVIEVPKCQRANHLAVAS